MTQIAEHQIPAETAGKFITAGKALFTLVSKNTGARYTYKVRQADPKPGQLPVWFVSLMTGPDNESCYSYIGILRDGKFKVTAKSKLPETSAPVAGFAWTFERLGNPLLDEKVEIWHAGKCGRCGKTLTVPTSVASGFGPECIGKVM